MAVLVEAADAVDLDRTLATPSRSNKHEKQSYYSYGIWLVLLIVMWEFSKAVLALWTEKLLKVTGLRAKSNQEDKKTNKRGKKMTRDVGVQSPCTYRWKWEQPRFVPLPEAAAGAFI